VHDAQPTHHTRPHDPSYWRAGGRSPAPPQLPKPAPLIPPATPTVRQHPVHVAYHPDGLFAAVYSSGDIDLWDTHTKTLRWRTRAPSPSFPIHTLYDTSSLAFSADAKALVFQREWQLSITDTAFSEQVIVCEVSAGRCATLIEADIDTISVGGDLLLINASSHQSEISLSTWQLWSLNQRALLHSGPGFAVISPNGEHLLVEDQRTLTLHPSDDPTRSRTLATDTDKDTDNTFNAFSPDSASIVRAPTEASVNNLTDGILIRLWDVSANLPPQTVTLHLTRGDDETRDDDEYFSGDIHLHALAFSQDGALLRVSSAFIDGTMRSYDEPSAHPGLAAVISTRTAQKVQAPADTQWRYVFEDTVFGPRQYALPDDTQPEHRDAFYRFMDTLVGASPPHVTPITSLQTSANSQWLLTKSGDALALWHLPSGALSGAPIPLSLLQTAGYAPVNLDAGTWISPDGSSLYDSSAARLSNTEFHGPDLFHDGIRIDGVLRVMDRSGSARVIEQGSDLRMRLLAATEDGQALIACQTSSNTDYAIWNALTGDIFSAFVRIHLADGAREVLPARFTACPPPEAISAATMRAVAFGPPPDATVVDGRFRSAELTQEVNDCISQQDEGEAGAGAEAAISACHPDQFYNVPATDLLTPSQNPIHVVDLLTGQALLSFEDDVHARAVALSPDGERLALFDDADLSLSIWSVSQGELLGMTQLSITLSDKDPIQLLFSADGRALLVIQPTNIFAIDPARVDSLSLPFPALAAPLTAVTLRASNNHLLTASADGAIQQWDLNGLPALFSASSSSDAPSSP
jgi:WD40 repeat protein